MRTVGVRLLAETAQYQRDIRAAGKSMRDFRGELDRANQRGRLDEVTQATAGLGLGLVGVAGIAVKFSMDFDKQMSAVKAATHGSTGEIERLRQASLEAGKDTQFSATQAAKGVEELAKAGVSTADILGGGLKGALDLAAAGQIGVGEAAELSASALTQFKLKGEDVPHVADLLSAAAGKAQGTVQDMGAALNQAGLIAAGTGLSIEETTGTLAAFASAGLLGSDAGTSFKTMLQAVQAPSGKTKELMDELGVSAYDTAGNFVGIANFAQNLKDKLAGLTPEMRANAMAQIFGSDATRAANILYEQGAEGIQKWIGKTNDAGFAAETAAIKTDNLAGDLERLKGSLETMAIEAGSGANGGLRVLTQGVEALVEQFSELPAGVGSTVTVLAGVGGAALLAGAGVLRVRHTTRDALDELRQMGPAGARTATGLGKVTSAAGKAAGAFVALQIAGAVFDSFQTDLNPKVDAVTVGLNEFADSGKVTGEMARLVSGDLENFQKKFAFLADEDNGRRQAVKNMQEGFEGLVPGLDGVNTSLAKTAERTTAFDQAFAGLVEGGNIPQAQANFAALAKVLAVNGVTVDEVKKQFPQYAAALEVASSKTGTAVGMFSAVQGPMIGVGSSAAGAAPSVTRMATEMNAAKTAAEGQKDALKELADAQRALINPAFGVLDAQSKLTTAQGKYNKAVKAHGKDSKEAKAASKDLALAALDLQEQVGALGEGFDGKLTPSMRATLKAAKLTDPQIKAVEQRMLEAKTAADKFDGKYAANASAPGAKGAKTALDNATTAAEKYAGNYDAHVKVVGEKKAKEELQKLLTQQRALQSGLSLSAAGQAVKRDQEATNRRLYGHAAEGGRVPGSSPHKRADNIPTMLTADEWVHPVDAVDFYGSDFMAAVQKRRIPIEDVQALGYAGGGRVTWPFNATAAKTRIPSYAEAMAAVRPEFGGVGKGGTLPFILAAVRSQFPGMRLLSGYRPGSRTLSGSRSYHADNRAGDFPPSRDLAKWWNERYKAQTKEFISPFQEFNINNGRRWRATGAVWRQHNFAGGNAHDHIAMGEGGVIDEHVVGVGRSGRTYEFGERGTPETVTPGLPQASPPPVVVHVHQAAAAGVARSGPMIGTVMVNNPTEADMVINALAFGLARL